MKKKSASALELCKSEGCDQHAKDTEFSGELRVFRGQGWPCIQGKQLTTKNTCF